MLKQEQKSAFQLLIRPIQHAIKEKGFKKPTEAQEKAIPLILEGKNVLLIAPTASGKTEAAILPIFNNFLLQPEREPGINILYITPLRALNRDLLERLEWWCNKLDIKIAVRHGDTEVRERSKQARRPPEFLITTPETLQAILAGRVMRRHLQAVKWVVVDEVHELACDKRGSQLSIALERLRMLTSKKDFQIIGLSATIGTPEKVAKFLVGTERSCEIVKVPVARYIKLEVIYPSPTDEDYALAEKLYTHPEVAARLRVIKELIERHNSVLLFTNTRAIAEVLASRFKVWDMNFPLSIHHGSLSKLSRITAEHGLKSGELKGVVCTSSLELGIDVGRIDLVIQYNSPRQVTRLLQRVGRSGHRIGGVANGKIITLDADDTLEALVIGRRGLLEELEEAKIPEKPLDALTHQIVGMLIFKKRWKVEDILELFRKAYPYRNLTVRDFVHVLNYMHSRYPRLAWFASEDLVFLKPRNTKEMYSYYYENLSMIPDEKQFLVIDEVSNSPVGILDESFVAEYGEPTTKFICRGSPWVITAIHGDRIYVKPIDDPTGAIPSWIGEEIPVPFEVAMEVGRIRRFVEEGIRTGKSEEQIVKNLAKKYPAKVRTIKKALLEVFEQAKSGLEVPTDRRVTTEAWNEYVIVNCCFGTLVNRTLSRIIAHILSEDTGYVIGVQQDPYRIVFQVPKGVTTEHIIDVLKRLSKCENLESLAINALVKTGLFKRRLIHVARKFGALEKWVDFSSVSLKQLVKSFEGTVIFEEAVNDVLREDSDLKNTKLVLSMLRSGQIEVKNFGEVKELTPISRLGMERIGRKTDIVPPERMHKILLEATKARILNEAKTLVCINCWRYIKTSRVIDIKERDLICPYCQNRSIGISDESEEFLNRLKEKKVYSREEKKIIERIKKSAEIIRQHGLKAVIAFAGKKLTASDVELILDRWDKIDDRFFELILEAEKRALRRRFW